MAVKISLAGVCACRIIISVPDIADVSLRSQWDLLGQ